MSEVAFVDFPDEVLLKIIYELDWISAICFSLTCKRIYDIIHDREWAELLERRWPLLAARLENSRLEINIGATKTFFAVLQALQSTGTTQSIGSLLLSIISGKFVGQFYPTRANIDSRVTFRYEDPNTVARLRNTAVFALRRLCYTEFNAETDVKREIVENEGIPTILSFLEERIGDDNVVSNCIAAVNNILLFRDRDNDLRGKCATNRICDLCARALQEHPESESVNDYSASLIFGLFLIEGDLNHYGESGIALANALIRFLHQNHSEQQFKDTLGAIFELVARTENFDKLYELDLHKHLEDILWQGTSGETKQSILFSLGSLYHHEKFATSSLFPIFERVTELALTDEAPFTAIRGAVSFILLLMRKSPAFIPSEALLHRLKQLRETNTTNPSVLLAYNNCMGTLLFMEDTRINRAETIHKLEESIEIMTNTIVGLVEASLPYYAEEEVLSVTLEVLLKFRKFFNEGPSDFLSVLTKLRDAKQVPVEMLIRLVTLFMDEGMLADLMRTSRARLLTELGEVLKMTDNTSHLAVIQGAVAALLFHPDLEEMDDID